MVPIGEGMQVFIAVDGVLTEVVSVKTASYRLQYSIRTIQQWCDEGKLIAINAEYRWWIPVNEIERVKTRDNLLRMQLS